jgi:hypothetical protein
MRIIWRVRKGRNGWWQEAGPGELLAAFDAVRKTHEAMKPDEFNDDGTYKGGINQVRRVGIDPSAVTCKCAHRRCHTGTCQGSINTVPRVTCRGGTLAHAHVCRRCLLLRGDEGRSGLGR